MGAMKWIRRVVWAVLLLVVVALGAGVFYATRALPQTEGRVQVQGLREGVTIERDAHGIPTIRAGNLHDLMWGLGFAHAQDRLWQIETHQRIGAGRLAEAFGEAAVKTDQFLRALAVRETARRQWESVQGDARLALQAYADGINTYVRDHMQARPPEFLILGLQPTTWEPADSLAWAIMMAWDLGGNWNAELQRMRLALRLPVERINEVMPPYPGTQPLPTADYARLFRELKVDPNLGQQAELAAPESGVDGVGSNNWVLAGTRTSTGAPLLGNDPHLKLSAPALWYFARLEAPGLRVAGATMPGLPMVVLGQNEHIAWGFTNTGPDVQDLYLEEIHPEDPSRYRTPEGWRPFETREEIIKVKGSGDVRMTVRSTRHGPVISDAPDVADGLTGAARRPRYALAMRWTALDVPNTTVEAGLALNRARSVDEFLRASALHVAPMQNMAVADRAGRIAMVAAGRVPLRGPQHDLKGLVPALGWEARYDWTGYLDPGLTPREVDPARGWIATANQRIHGPDYPHFITSEWTLPYRQQRIEEWLEARPRHDMDSLARLHADVTSLAARKMLSHVRKARSDHPLAAAALAQLEAFDGRMEADRAAPLILWSWTRHLQALLFADELGDKLWGSLNRNFYDAMEQVLQRQDAWWCDDKRTTPIESCQQMVDQALTLALDELQQLQGPDPGAWRWGQAHQARSEHRPFSKVPALARFFELRTPVGGDTYTVNAARVNLAADAVTGERYLNEHGPSLRALYDLGDPAQSRVMHSTGQSGLPFSRWYRSFVGPWAEVAYVPLWASEAKEVLSLEPR